MGDSETIETSCFKIVDGILANPALVNSSVEEGKCSEVMFMASRRSQVQTFHTKEPVDSTFTTVSFRVKFCVWFAANMT